MIQAAYILPHPPLAVPEVGEGKEKTISATIESFERAAAEIKVLAPETIIYISPHSITYGDYIHISPFDGASGSFADFGQPQPLLKTKYDEELVSEIYGLCNLRGFPAGTLGEKRPRLDHGVLVPMYYINKEYASYQSVRVSISGLPLRQHYQMGQIIQKAVENLGRKVVVIASGDLSHKLSEQGPYGYHPSGPVFDREICRVIQNGDFLGFLRFDENEMESAGECGLRSFVMMAGLLDGMGFEPELMSYEGPFGVGYACGAFRNPHPAPNRDLLSQFDCLRREEIRQTRLQESSYAALARQSLESFVRDKKMTAIPPGLPEEMLNSQAGTFVSLKKDGRLRGCIGTITPAYKNIAEEIIYNAVAAGVSDRRFDPVAPEELAEIVYSVDVLSVSEPVTAKTQLDPEQYGVIVKRGNQRGLLLPNLPGVDTVDGQLSIALKKANIGEEEEYEMERFRVERYK